MRIAYQRHLVLWTVMVDTAMVVLSFLAAFLLRFSGLTQEGSLTPSLAEYLPALIVVLPIYVLVFRELRLYAPMRFLRRSEEIFLVLKAVTYALLILMALTFIYRHFSFSRIFFVFLWILSGFLISTGRYGLIQWEYSRRLSQKDILEVLILGTHQKAFDLIAWMGNNPHYGRVPVGFLTCDPAQVGKTIQGVPVLGLTGQWEEFLKKLKPHQVVLLDEQFPREKITDLVAVCEDQLIAFKMGVDVYGLVARNVDVEYITSVPLLGFRPLPLDDPWNRFSKRMFDLTVGLLLALLLLPVGILVALLIRWTDRGPVFFIQERIGRDGKSFFLFKFRTMVPDAEAQAGPVLAKPDDGRRTRMGAFLRRWNLDELPQLWNVIRGEMSLVGPRPERPHFVEKFRGSVPRYMWRHKVKSGMTGWAQVHGLRGNTSIEDRIKYDLYYMENWSLLLDIEILAMTTFAFRNAY